MYPGDNSAITWVDLVITIGAGHVDREQFHNYYQPFSIATDTFYILTTPIIYTHNNTSITACPPMFYSHIQRLIKVLNTNGGKEIFHFACRSRAKFDHFHLEVKMV